MIHKVEKILLKWKHSLLKHEKVISNDLSSECQVLDSFIGMNTNKSDKLVKQLRICLRQYRFNDGRDNILSSIERALKTITRRYHPNINQTERYKDVTRRLFAEHIRKIDNRSLRNIDVRLENQCVVKTVRRVVEKRMCQEYCKHHKDAHCSNKGRYGMRRAVSYQLHNIGQIEGKVERSCSTHWKRMFDPITKMVVMKPKVSYETLDEAKSAIVGWEIKHPYDNIPMQAYECQFCHHYHIGHDHLYAM